MEGYLVAERPVVNHLLSHYCRKLEKLYQSTRNRHKDASAIMQEYLGQMQNIGSSLLREALRVTMVLKEYDYLFRRSEQDYTDTAKTERLRNLLGQFETPLEWEFPGEEDPLEAPEKNSDMLSEEKPEELAYLEYGGIRGIDFFEKPSPPATGRRAVDTEEYNVVQKMKLPGEWERAVQRYGINFLLRIHFRKYEFEKVRKLLKTGRIQKEEDIRYIRDTLRLMETRVEKDFRLRIHMAKMQELRRMAHNRLMRIRQEKNL